MKWNLLFAMLVGAASLNVLAASPKPALTQELSYPGGSDGYMSCESDRPTIIGGTATPGDRFSAFCTLGNQARGTTIPASTRFVTSYISFTGKYAPTNCLIYVFVQDPAPSLYGVKDFLPLNSMLTNDGSGSIWFSGGGAYHTVWEPGQTPSVNAIFCGTGPASDSFLMVTVHGHYEAF